MAKTVRVRSTKEKNMSDKKVIRTGQHTKKALEDRIDELNKKKDAEIETKKFEQRLHHRY